MDSITEATESSGLFLLILKRDKMHSTKFRTQQRYTSLLLQIGTTCKTAAATLVLQLFLEQYKHYSLTIGTSVAATQPLRLITRQSLRQHESYFARKLAKSQERQLQGDQKTYP